VSSIIKNILETKIEKVDFDFTKSASNNSLITERLTYSQLPISVDLSTWTIISDHEKTYMKKDFILYTINHLLYFVNEIIKYANNKDHHPTIVINNMEVSVTLFTHLIDDVTDLDIDMSKYIDELHNDVKYIQDL